MPAELDIAGNIKAIEKIKSDLLSGVSNLYSNMLADMPSDMLMRDDISELRADNIADIVILSYRLGQKLGISSHELDLRIVSKLRLNILDEGGFAETSPLLKYFDKHRR